MVSGGFPSHERNIACKTMSVWDFGIRFVVGCTLNVFIIYNSVLWIAD